MIRALTFALALFGVAAAANPALAQEPPPASGLAETFRVDDSGTLVLDPVLPMNWQPSGMSRASPLVSASTKVSVQLNVAPWTGRTGRIYMHLPRSAGTVVRASWQTGGTLLPGILISGERAMVFSGLITAPVMRDLMDIKLEADGSRLLQSEALAFGFEIEVTP